MQVNSVNSNQNFGMAIRINPNAQKILAKRMKSDADIQLLESYVTTEANNPFKVDIREELGKLVTYISDCTKGATKQTTVLRENFFEKHFNSPIVFIERCCKKADKMNEDTYAPDINKKLKDIFEKTNNLD